MDNRPAGIGDLFLDSYSPDSFCWYLFLHKAEAAFCGYRIKFGDWKMQLEDKIRVNHVSKVFKMYNTPMDKMKEALSVSGKVLHTDFYAVTDLSFSVEQGEILGIMGRNGSGKSTLLKMITGIYEPSEGTIEITGKISSLLELGTGFHM